MTENRELAHKAVAELRELREQPPFQATEDIDIVWVVSQPGTINQTSRDGIWEGESGDRDVIDAGIGIVKQVTALRTKKDLETVTKEDIGNNGPILFYNGESETTKNHMYPQNEDLVQASEDPAFPIPKSKILIQEIPELGTHTQIKEFANYLITVPDVKKVAVVSLAPHSRRVGRYLNKWRHLFPKDFTFINAPVPITNRVVGKTLREVRKIPKYVATGDMSEEPLEGF